MRLIFADVNALSTPHTPRLTFHRLTSRRGVRRCSAMEEKRGCAAPTAIRATLKRIGLRRA